jgi:DNA-binding GntR family transcriptional regulator
MTQLARADNVMLADLTEQTYQLLRDRILRRKIAADQKVSVDDIARSLGVSRTPVTDALKRLAADGLVEIVPRRGTFVTRLTTRDVHELFDLRLMMESYAANQLVAAGQGMKVAEDVERAAQMMARAVDAEDYVDYEAFIEHDRLFHRTIVAALGNRRLLSTYDALNTHMYVVRAHYVETVEAARDAQEEHAAIRRALVSDEPLAVEEAISTHIVRVRDRIGTIINREGGFI